MAKPNIRPNVKADEGGSDLRCEPEVAMCPRNINHRLAEVRWEIVPNMVDQRNIVASDEDKDSVPCPVSSLLVENRPEGTLRRVAKTINQLNLCHGLPIH